MGEVLNHGSFRLLYSSKDAVVCRMAYLLWRTAIQKKANQNPASNLTASFRTYSGLRFGLAHILMATSQAKKGSLWAHYGAGVKISVSDNAPSLYLDRTRRLHGSLGTHHWSWATYRNYTPGHPKTEVFAEVICRKSEERITERKQRDLGTSPTPVWPLSSHHRYFLIPVHM